MIKIHVYEDDNARAAAPDETLAELLQLKTSAGTPPVLWIDVSQPTEGEWALLSSEFDLHPLALEDAKKRRQRVKLDTYTGYLFLTVRVWSGQKSVTDDLLDATEEIDIFLGERYLMTVHNGCALTEEIQRNWERYPGGAGDGAGLLLYFLLDAVVDDMFPVLDQLDTEIDALEMKIYHSDEHLDLAPAVAIKKRLLLLRQTVAPLREIVNQLLRPDHAKLVSPVTRVYFQDVYDHTLRLVEQVDLHRDILGDVVDVIMARTNNRLNQVMKTLTGISTILMSDALIAGIYGMNFQHMPELATRYGYYYVLAAMLIVAGGLAWFFRKIRWF